MKSKFIYRNGFAYEPLPAGGGKYRLNLSDGTERILPWEEISALPFENGQTPRSDFIAYEETLAQRKRASLPPPELLVSACLAGECCRYDGKSNQTEQVKAYADKGLALPVCPECAGGLPCPRAPCERKGARILDRDAIDRTLPFRLGAEKCLEALRIFPIRAAILKERSPSCGTHIIYDGTFSRRRIPGMGIFAEMLHAQGIALYSEETMTTLERMP